MTQGKVSRRCSIPSGYIYTDVAFTFKRIISEPVTIRIPEEMHKIARERVGNLTVEEFWVAGLNTAQRLVVLHRVSSGTLNASLAHPRECFRVPILLSCASVIFFHNHPSGNLEPSQEDIALTKQLVESGRILEIPVHDHLIVGAIDAGFTSFAERGLM